MFVDRSVHYLLTSTSQCIIVLFQKLCLQKAMVYMNGKDLKMLQANLLHWKCLSFYKAHTSKKSMIVQVAFLIPK